jgi:hypothetical protein
MSTKLTFFSGLSLLVALLLPMIPDPACPYAMGKSNDWCRQRPSTGNNSSHANSMVIDQSFAHNLSTTYLTSSETSATERLVTVTISTTLFDDDFLTITPLVIEPPKVTGGLQGHEHRARWASEAPTTTMSLAAAIVTASANISLIQLNLNLTITKNSTSLTNGPIYFSSATILAAINRSTSATDIAISTSNVMSTSTVIQTPKVSSVTVTKIISGGKHTTIGATTSSASATLCFNSAHDTLTACENAGSRAVKVSFVALAATIVVTVSLLWSSCTAIASLA